MYLEGFNTIIEDLNSKLSSEQYQLCAQIEELLLNGITGQDKEPVTNLIVKYYGKGTNDKDAPVYNMESTKLMVELTFVKEQWKRIEPNKHPKTFKDDVNMIKKSLKSTQLQLWELEAPIVLALVQIIIATAGTSAYAERTFSLARRLKSYLRSNMGDDMFDALGLMGWYKKDVNKMLDLVHIGTEYIE